VRNLAANSLLTLISVAVCLVLAEVAVRIIDGESPVTLQLPKILSSQGVDTTGGHLDKLSRAASVDRDLFFSDPPPLANRRKPPPDWLELEKTVQVAPPVAADGSYPFRLWDLFKAWNSVFVGDPCTHDYMKRAPGTLFVFDPPDGQPRPTYRYLPNATGSDGLVTNAVGWRGPAVSVKRSPKTIRIVFVGASTVAEIRLVPFSGPEYLHNWLNRWAKARKLDVTFEVLNAGREGISSIDIAAIVKNEVAPIWPDLVVYYEGGNELQLATVVKEVPKGTPRPAGAIARWLRDAAAYSSLARRAEGLIGGGEWPKPDYEIVWPKGLDEFDPDITRPDLPVNLSRIIHNLDSIRTDLAKVGSEFSVASFHWLAKDGLVVDAARQKAILETLNVSYFPFRYRDLERLTAFENRVFAKYDAVHGLPFIDVAGHMPYDPNLFSDAIHNTVAGIKLRAWIELQQLVPIIEKHLADGSWPRPVPKMGDPPAYQPRQIHFTCKSS